MLNQSTSIGPSSAFAQSGLIAALAAKARSGYSLDQRFYCDDEVFAADMQQIVNRKWIVAGHVDRVRKQGDHFLFKIGRESIIVPGRYSDHERRVVTFQQWYAAQFGLELTQARPPRLYEDRLGSCDPRHALRSRYVLQSVRCTTTRRLCARPSRVLLSATGLASP